MIANNAQDWNSLGSSSPVNPFDFILNATFGGTGGALFQSSNYGIASPWSATSTVVSAEPTCVALQADNLQKSAEAANWNFVNSTANLSPLIPPDLRRLVFLRTNADPQIPEWGMWIPLNLGASTYTEVQLSDLANAGNNLSTVSKVPVIQFIGSFTGQVFLELTVKGFGNRQIGIRLNNSISDEMFVLNAVLTDGAFSLNRVSANGSFNSWDQNTDGRRDRTMSPFRFGPGSPSDTIPGIPEFVTICDLSFSCKRPPTISKKTTQPGCEDGNHGC